MTRHPHQEGYSLLILMAGITIMLIGMGVAAPTWQHVMQDDREQELLYRGGAIADGIVRYQKKNGGAMPVSLDVLVKGRFLRRAYKDPMTKDGQWRFIRQGEGIAPPGTTRPGTSAGSTTGPSPSPQPSPSPGMGIASAGGVAGAPLGGFVGVASRNTKKSLRMLNNAKTYDTWLFIAGRPRIVGKQPVIGPIGVPGLASPGTRPSPPSLPAPPPTTQ
jgi:type II secretory pathway pseudopilin PulG